MMQIIVNSTVLDTYLDEVVAVTYKVADIAQFGQRTLNATNQFKIPATDTNKAALGNPEIVEHFNPYVYTQTAATVKQGGYELIRNGALQIVSATSTEYEIVIYSKVRSFFDAIAGKSLRDLDLDYLYHIQDFATVTGSYINTEGYIYPLQDLFANSPNSLINVTLPYRVDYSFPMVFAKTLLDEIFKQANFAYQANDLLEDPRFDKLLVSPDLEARKTLTTDRAKTSGLVSETLYSEPQTATSPIARRVLIDFGDINSDFFGCFATRTVDNYGDLRPCTTYQAAFKGSYTFRAAMVNNTPNSSSLFNWQIKKLDTLGVYTALYNNTSAPSVGVNTYPEQTVTVDLEVGDQVFLLAATSDGDFTVDKGTYLICDNVSIVSSYGSPWVVADYLPDISQTDFLLNISKLFGLVFEQRAYSNVIDVRFFKELYQNRSIAPDWSDKIQPDSEKVVFSYGDYAQLNEFKWKEDETNGNSELGNSAFSIDNSNLKSATTLFQLDFAASEEVVYQNRMVTIPLYELNDDGDYENSGSPEPRLVMLGYDSGSLEVTDGDDSEVITTLPYTYFFNGDQPIGFNSFIADYYGNLVSSLRDAKQLTAKMKLTAKDVMDKDQLTPVFIRGNYYHVNEIKNFRPNQLIDVTLIKL